MPSVGHRCAAGADRVLDVWAAGHRNALDLRRMLPVVAELVLVDDHAGAQDVAKRDFPLIEHRRQFIGVLRAWEVALRWVSFRGFGVRSAPTAKLAEPRGRINRLRHRYVPGPKTGLAVRGFVRVRS